MARPRKKYKLIDIQNSHEVIGILDLEEIEKKTGIPYHTLVKHCHEPKHVFYRHYKLIEEFSNGDKGENYIPLGLWVEWERVRRQTAVALNNATQEEKEKAIKELKKKWQNGSW